VLSYEVVRTVLRHSRFQIPSGYFLAVQGITSGPLWDKVMSSLLGMEGASTNGPTSLPIAFDT
jgi:hypothetical protein